ncbi:Crp/Fnr family transcriptional regulator [Bacillus sp. FJAT-27225]|uniref:DoxX family membrane protein n=1 Tax=Bacillus sp. FJAT-27225 TaxID=1743144 RepID=UPI00080C2C6E|nr:DoxX family membrane protein [Bacillus sp. FJAT-27225]OCA84202.1 Crp/Fnr family transcriptional regulator [Bacillus sp. FJAT-27225]
MFNKFLRENNIVAALLAVLRVYLGYAWFTAGLGKIQSGAFDASGFIKGAIANPVKGPDGGVVYSWYVDFLQSVALPNIDLFNVLVPWGELLVGLGLMLGCLTTAAAFFGLMLNFAFFFAGTVSHNPTDILFGFIILAAGANAGKYGLDRFVLPYINKAFFKKHQVQN